MMKAKKYLRLFALFAMAALLLAGCQSNDSAKADNEKTLMASIVNASGDFDVTGATSLDDILAILLEASNEITTITDPQYNYLFKEESAAAGAAAIIAAGNAYINGYSIPATEGEFKKDYPDGYKVNEVVWIAENDGGYTGGKNGGNSYSTYAQAAYETFIGLPGGLEIRVYDTDGDNYADRLETEYFEPVIASSIVYNDDGTVSVVRSKVDTANASSHDGSPYVADYFTETSGEVIKKENFDSSIQEGDMILFWYGTDGWCAKRALQVNGVFNGGEDHHHYTIDGVSYREMMGISKDNIIISNRDGEFLHTHEYFGFFNNEEGLTISLWFVPTAVEGVYAIPIAFTTDENAAAFLQKAIDFAKNKLAEIDQIVENADEAETGKVWATQESYDEVVNAIARAEKALADDSTPNDILDYNTYLIYLSLAGNGNVLGGFFQGYQYEGIDHGLDSEKDLITSVVIRTGDVDVTDTDSPYDVLEALLKASSEAITITDPQYDYLFKEGNAAAGTAAIVAAGNAYINGYAIPATEEEFKKDYPDGFNVNEVTWIAENDGGYTGGKNGENSYDTYAEAAYETFIGLPGGLEIRVYDTDGDNYADRLESEYLEGLIASKITHNDDGTVSVVRSKVDTVNASSRDGRSYDGARFTETSGEVIKEENFDSSIQEGDMILFWYGTDGWCAERAVQVNGILNSGEDHRYYEVDNVKYDDIMGLSRDNLVISSRNGEFLNTHNYLGFLDNEEGLRVSLWFVPTAVEGVYGAPIGFTTDENAAVFLQKAIDVAKNKLDKIDQIVGNPDEAEEGKTWTTQENYDEVVDAIARAEKVLGDENTPNDILDYNTYLIYLSLAGSLDDLGAFFADYQYEGIGN